jgi:hypothetical protein
MSTNQLKRLIIKNTHPLGNQNVHKKNIHQISIYESFAEHEIEQILKKVSQWLVQPVNRETKLIYGYHRSKIPSGVAEH